jgi:F0F1-type ATP synthase assembly protein I
MVFKMTKKRVKRLAKVIGGTLVGAAIGLIINRLASGNGSQCMIICQTPIAIAYFGLVGLLLSMK